MESERIEMQESLVNEISKGMAKLKQLKVSSSEQESALERMLSSYEEALFILTGRAPQGGQCRSGITSSSDPPASSPSVPKQEGGRDAAVKRRRTLKEVLKCEVRKCKIKVSGNDFLGAADDGYSWRKYGQKIVKDSIYPRFYFRCRDKSCVARKHEERSTIDPATIDVTYKGVHTCQAKSEMMPPFQNMVAACAQNQEFPISPAVDPGFLIARTGLDFPDLQMDFDALYDRYLDEDLFGDQQLDF